MPDSEVQILDTNGEPEKIASHVDDAEREVQVVWLVTEADLA